MSAPITPNIRVALAVPGTTLTLEVSLEMISPDRAKSILDGRGRNRLLRPNHIARMAADIRAERWELNGEPLLFDEHDRLVDGQNRLSAVVRAGKAVPFLCVWNVDAKFVDAGMTRTVADMMRIAGATDYAMVSAIAANFLKFQRGQIKAQNISPSKPETYQMALDISEAVSQSVAVAKRKGYRPLHIGCSLLATLHYAMVRTNPGRAHEFFDGLLDGAGLDPDSPILMLRNRLLAEAVKGKTFGAVLPWVKLAYVIKAWQAFLSGKRLGLMRMRDDEPFPTIPGWDWTTLSATRP